MSVLKDNYDEMCDLKDKGYNSTQVQNWLREEKGVQVNARSIREFFQNRGNAFGKSKNQFESQLDDAGFNPPENWSYGWLKGKEGSVFVKNPETEINREDYQDLFKDVLDNIKPIKLPKVSKSNKKALRAIISDAHVGMEPNTEDSVFGFEYNGKIFRKNLSVVYQQIKDKVEANGNFDMIVIDDLGDGLDGYNKETTRGGHKLPQNMSNKEGWRTYVSGKLNMYTDIVNMNAAKKYQFRNVSNCNHSGDWGYTANYAIKMAIESMFNNVEYIIMDKHMEHFYYGDHCFLLAHGKDKQNMFKNMPLHLNDKTSNLIRQYIDHYEIKSKYVHVDKGDLHQVGYNREPRFDYRNYMSFAPPSAWVQANFGVSYCGFSLQVIPKNNNQIEHSDIFFDLKKV